MLGTLVVLSESHAARAAKKKERERDGIPARAGLTGPRTSVQPQPRGRTGAGLRRAPTAAHNQIRARLSSSLKRHLPRKWKLYEEAAMLRTGLQMRPVSSARVRETGCWVSEADLETGSMSLSRWRPDFVVVSFKAKKIAILELCRPFDTSPGQLQAAYERKINLYGPLAEALGHYSDSGWSVNILPWVVGARGLVLEQAMHHALEYIDVPKAFWRPIIEDPVLASVSALAFMQRIRFSPPALV